MADNAGSKALMAGLLGAMVGAGVGILLAPKSGEDTIKDMRSRLDEAKETAGNVASKARKKFKEFREEVKREAEARIPDEQLLEERS